MDWKNFAESLLRWIHVLSGILWVGHLYFFNFVNAQFAPTMDAETKRKVVPELMPRALWWFRWGGALTWVTGVFLLMLVFYHGAQALEGGVDAKWAGFPLFMLLATFMAPFLYEFLAQTVLKSNVAMFLGGYLLVAAALYGYRQAEFTTRGTQIHLGALFGTIMAVNAWFRIWPAQRRIVAAVKAGEAPDADLVLLAAQRSKHNTYLSVPLVFFMLNSHSTWATSNFDPFPVYPALVVLFGWALTAHLYMAATTVGRS